MKVLTIHDHDCRLTAADHGTAALAGRPGGISIYLESVLNALAARGHDLAMVRYRSDDALQDDPAARYYELRSCSNVLRRGAVEALRDIIAAEDPDIVHLHSIYYAMHPKVLAALATWKPVIHTLHDVTPLCFWHTKLRPDGALCEQAVGRSCVTCGCYRVGAKASYGRDLVRLFMHGRHLDAYRSLPLTLTPSGYIRDELVRNGFDDSRIRVVPLFSRFAGENAPQQNTGTPTVLYVGRLAPEKGIFALIDAMARITERAWRLQVVGDGPSREDAIARARTAGIHDRATFAPACGGEALVKHYAAADIVVVPSLIPESFNLVGVEAMSLARPVVAFRSGGIAEWLRDGHNGLMVPHGDVPAMAAAVARLLDNADLRRQMGAQGRCDVAERFTLDRHVEALLDSYTQSGATVREVLV